eukprot:1158458-Pelagomonas_calceolata.AAC.14
MDILDLLGDSEPAPAPAAPSAAPAQPAASGETTCALRAVRCPKDDAGTVWCWMGLHRPEGMVLKGGLPEV